MTFRGSSPPWTFEYGTFTFTLANGTDAICNDQTPSRAEAREAARTETDGGDFGEHYRSIGFRIGALVRFDGRHVAFADTSG